MNHKETSRVEDYVEQQNALEEDFEEFDDDIIDETYEPPKPSSQESVFTEYDVDNPPPAELQKPSKKRKSGQKITKGAPRDGPPAKMCFSPWKPTKDGDQHHISGDYYRQDDTESQLLLKSINDSMLLKGFEMKNLEFWVSDKESFCICAKCFKGKQIVSNSAGCIRTSPVNPRAKPKQLIQLHLHKIHGCQSIYQAGFRTLPEVLEVPEGTSDGGKIRCAIAAEYALFKDKVKRLVQLGNPEADEDEVIRAIKEAAEI